MLPKVMTASPALDRGVHRQPDFVPDSDRADCRTPESVGDYASGTNHVLPTYGYARMYSGVSLDSFQKKMTVQVCSLAMHCGRFHRHEGLLQKRADFSALGECRVEMQL